MYVFIYFTKFCKCNTFNGPATTWEGIITAIYLLTYDFPPNYCIFMNLPACLLATFVVDCFVQKHIQFITTRYYFSSISPGFVRTRNILCFLFQLSSSRGVLN